MLTTSSSHLSSHSHSHSNILTLAPIVTSHSHIAYKLTTSAPTVSALPALFPATQLLAPYRPNAATYLQVPFTNKEKEGTNLP